MGDEVTVRITLAGVRKERLPRLQTAIKSYVQRFAREAKVDISEPEVQKKPRKGR